MVHAHVCQTWKIKHTLNGKHMHWEGSDLELQNLMFKEGFGPCLIAIPSVGPFFSP